MDKIAGAFRIHLSEVFLSTAKILLWELVWKFVKYSQDSSIYAYILLEKVRTLLEWTDGFLSKISEVWLINTP